MQKIESKDVTQVVVITYSIKMTGQNWIKPGKTKRKTKNI